jgi:bifunctional non-homologous end joining protein LigD
MECTEADKPPTGDGWQYEPKLDGYRGIAVLRNGKAYLFSRRGRSFNRQFHTLLPDLESLGLKSAVLDGEIVAFDEHGLISFSMVEDSGLRKGRPVSFFVFDLLSLDGRDLLRKPLTKRRQLLEKRIRNWPEYVRRCPILKGDVDKMLVELRQLGFEGVVAKRMDSNYKPGARPGTWVKCKLQRSDDFLIGGYIPSGQTLSEILVGKPEGDHLVFVESVDRGFVPRTRKQVFNRLAKLARRSCPFSNLPERSVRGMNADKMKRVQWVSPRVVVEIAFNNWTERGHLRHARFLRLRLDKM